MGRMQFINRGQFQIIMDNIYKGTPLVVRLFILLPYGHLLQKQQALLQFCTKSVAAWVEIVLFSCVLCPYHPVIKISMHIITSESISWNFFPSCNVKKCFITKGMISPLM